MLDFTFKCLEKEHGLLHIGFFIFFLSIFPEAIQCCCIYSQHVECVLTENSELELTENSELELTENSELS